MIESFFVPMLDGSTEERFMVADPKDAIALSMKLGGACVYMKPGASYSVDTLMGIAGDWIESSRYGYEEYVGRNDAWHVRCPYGFAEYRDDMHLFSQEGQKEGRECLNGNEHVVAYWDDKNAPKILWGRMARKMSDGGCIIFEDVTLVPK
jgi:hypothetical protein